LNVEIIRAQPEHLPVISRLADIIWGHHYPGIISEAQIDYMLKRMYGVDVLRQELESAVVYNCLFADSELVGYSAHSPAVNEMKLHKLYVHPAHQRKGFGSLLLVEVERDTRARRYETLILAVNKANQQAIAAYRKHGFTIREAVVVDIGGGFVMDDYVMEKKMAALSRDAATNS
jgi:diamine N-acetyltransferase